MVLLSSSMGSLSIDIRREFYENYDPLLVDTCRSRCIKMMMAWVILLLVFHYESQTWITPISNAQGVGKSPRATASHTQQEKEYQESLREII